MQRYFHRKCNTWDSCRQILLMKKREQQLQKNGRKKIRYEKKDNVYWLDGGKKNANQQWLEIVYTQIPATISQTKETSIPSLQPVQNKRTPLCPYLPTSMSSTHHILQR